MGRHVLDLYDAIDDMPIGRFHRFNRCLMVDAGIGGDIAAVDAHLSKAVAFMKAERTDDAVRELENMRQGIWLVQNGISPKFSAFASLVAAVDGKSTEGWSDSELDALSERLKDIPFKVLSSELGEVKKKIDGELELYFPSVFGGTDRSSEWYASLKRMSLLVLREITEEADEEDRLKRESGRMLSMMAPRKFDGSTGAEVQYDREYETMSLAMTQQLHVDVKRMTVMEYYNAYEFLREQGKKMKAGRRSR